MRPSVVLVLVVCACGGRKPSVAALPQEQAAKPVPAPLASPADFAGIADEAERSRALYGEMSKVIFHPRCLNCHPPDDTPRQRNDLRLHDPPVVRGPDDHGAPGMECTSCHQDHNLDYARVPGAPHWALAPIEMAWIGRTPGEVCEQIKDPARNGGKSLAELAHHMGRDELVGWGWHPGADREPAPGTQEAFGALVDAWIATGAACPPTAESP